MGNAKRISKAETSSNNKRSRKSTKCNSQKKISFFFERKINESSADQQAGSYLNDVTNSQEDELNDKVTEKHRENSGGNDGQDNGIGLTEDKKGQASISNDVINRQNGTAASLSNETTFATSMYTDEFNTMLSTVLDGEDHLFSKDEIRIFNVYKALSVEAQHLFVRLWMRKQRWHRLEKLDYHRHVSDIHASTDELCDNGLVTTTLESIEDALALLTIEELKLLAEEQQITVELKKNRMDYVNALKAPARNGWRRTVFDYVGHCVMIKENIHAIFARLHLVYYRLNDPTSAENPMSSAILARINRRNYPEYVTMRSTSIWMSRQELLAYEKAYNVYQAFEDKVAKALATGRESKENLLKECWMLAENYIGVWEEQINHAREEAIDRPYYLRRFEAGWMYTHMLEHGTQILARLQEYTLESIILRKLLDQSLYRLGKRGEWYNRLALVQSLHLKSLPERERKKKALATCIEAIQDPRVHQIYLNRLQWRIQKLERDLAVPRREQHDFSYMILKKPQENVIYGERISDATIGYKSVWRSDDGAECSVEQLAIQYYKKKGYKSLHTESGVVSMLFMLLMWDVIFAPMPGVFETPYQSAPMDLWTDAFYVGRAGMINDRLSDIGRGKHLEIIKQTDERERARETFCAGVQWQYKREDLLEIAECIGPCALSSLCKLLAEEFGHRRGGMPDLCCWNYEEKKCLFVEVKGPGDRLSETQKLWIDTLAAFGVPAEVCHVKVWQADDVLLNDGEDL